MKTFNQLTTFILFTALLSSCYEELRSSATKESRLSSLSSSRTLPASKKSKQTKSTEGCFDGDARAKINLANDMRDATPGELVTYNLQIQNGNDSSCPDITYLLAQEYLPSEATASFPSSVTVSSGQVTNLNVQIQMPTDPNAFSGEEILMLSFRVEGYPHILAGKKLGFRLVEGEEESCLPPQVSSLTTVTPFAPPAYPDYLSTFFEPVFGNKMTRVTDKHVMGMGYHLRHDYSKRSAWNRDGSLIRLSGNPKKILDGRTYQQLADVSIGRTWSNVHPNIAYDMSGTRTFKRYTIHPENNYAVTSENLYVFSSSYTKVEIGSSETNMSADDKYIVFEATKSGSSNIWIIVFDVENLQIISEKNTNTTNIDWTSMSQSGNHVVVMGKTSGWSGYNGTSVYDRNMNYLRHVTNHTVHADLCINTAGQDVLVGIYRGRTWTLDTGHLIQNMPQMNKGGHVSCRNLDRPGWAYMSINNDEGHEELAYGEVVAIKLRASSSEETAYERFAKHYTDRDNGNYYDEAQAVVSPDGTKVLFASNWHLQSIINDPYPPAFVVEASCSE